MQPHVGLEMLKKYLSSTNKVKVALKEKCGFLKGSLVRVIVDSNGMQPLIRATVG